MQALPSAFFHQTSNMRQATTISRRSHRLVSMGVCLPLSVSRVTWRSRSLPRRNRTGWSWRRYFTGRPSSLAVPRDESFFGNPSHTALAVGQDVKIHRQHLSEEFRAPSSAVEDDRDAPARTDQVADLFQYGDQHSGHRGVGFSGHDKQRLSFLAVDPVVGRPRGGQAGPGDIGFGNRVFAMVGADMTIDIEEAHHAAALGDAAPGQFAAEFLAGFPRRQARQFAAQRFDLWQTIQSNDAQQT